MFRCRFAFVGCAASLMMVTGASALIDEPCEWRIAPLDTQPGDSIGQAVSISSDTALIGAPTGYGSTMGLGAAYVVRHVLGEWVEEQKLTASDAEPFDRFGIAVSIEDDVAIVGAIRHAENGAAYVFRRLGTEWVEEQKLIASDGQPGYLFGVSVSISGERVLVGSIAGAYVYRMVGGEWIEEQKLTGNAPGAFGWSVSLSGLSAVVGAPAEDCGSEEFCGCAYFFRYDDEWQLVRKHCGTYEFREFGTSVSMSGEWAVVTAQGSSSYARLFQGPDWTSAQFIDLDHVRSAAMSGDAALVGTTNPNSVYLYRHDGSQWNEDRVLTASDGTLGDEFGVAVAIHDQSLESMDREPRDWVAVVGAPAAGLDERGSAYVYNSRCCPADLDGSGEVGVSDLLTLLGHWGTDAGDLTGDGTTDVDDLLAVLAAWGPCPE